MKKKRFSFLFLFFLLGMLLGWSKSPIDQAIENSNQFVGKGEYAKALAELNKKVRTLRSLPQAEKDKLYFALGVFYNRTVLQPLKGKKYYEKISGSAKEWIIAQKHLIEINQQSDEFKKAENLLKELKLDTSRPWPEYGDKILEESVEYSQLAALFYQRGYRFLKSQSFYRAKEDFHKALELNPALGLQFPIHLHQRQAIKSWELFFYPKFYRWGAVLLIGVVAYLFIKAKPWLWLQFKHVGVFTVFSVVWWGFYRIGDSLLQQSLGESQPENNFYIVSVQSMPGYFWKIEFLYYGLCACFCVYLFYLSNLTLGRWKRAFSCALWACGVFGVTTQLFYWDHIAHRKLDQDRIAQMTQSAESAWYFNVLEVEPLLLTQPQRFKDLRIENLSNPVMRRWVEKRIGIDRPLPKRDDIKRGQDFED